MIFRKSPKTNTDQLCPCSRAQSHPAAPGAEDSVCVHRLHEMRGLSADQSDWARAHIQRAAVRRAGAVVARRRSQVRPRSRCDAAKDAGIPMPHWFSGSVVQWFSGGCRTRMDGRGATASLCAARKCSRCASKMRAMACERRPLRNRVDWGDVNLVHTVYIVNNLVNDVFSKISYYCKIIEASHSKC